VSTTGVVLGVGATARVATGGGALLSAGAAVTAVGAGGGFAVSVATGVADVVSLLKAGAALARSVLPITPASRPDRTNAAPTSVLKEGPAGVRRTSAADSMGPDVSLAVPKARGPASMSLSEIDITSS
jgi:hypothetical protein